MPDLVTVGVAIWRRSGWPLFCWAAGNLLALVILSPLLLSVLDGFAHSGRSLGFNIFGLSVYSIPAVTFPFSFLAGNWSEPVAIWQGDPLLKTLTFPYVTSILACAAAWCVIPALIVPARWRLLDKLCAGLAGILFLFIIRPDWLAVVMYELPFFKSMRWPFREGMQFLFFIHLLLLLRFPERMPRWQPALVLFSLIMFLLPLPFIRVPTLNPLLLDRQLLFSGDAEKFWTRVKAQLKPGDNIVTIIDWYSWQTDYKAIPYTLLDTGNFPAFFQVRSISGYSPTAPKDQVPLEATPGFWFGAFTSGQLRRILAQRPDLKVLRIENVHPLKITLSTGNGPAIDLTPCLPRSAFKPPDPISPSHP